MFDLSSSVLDYYNGASRLTNCASLLARRTCPVSRWGVRVSSLLAAGAAGCAAAGTRSFVVRVTSRRTDNRAIYYSNAAANAPLSTGPPSHARPPERNEATAYGDRSNTGRERRVCQCGSHCSRLPAERAQSNQSSQAR